MQQVLGEEGKKKNMTRVKRAKRSHGSCNLKNKNFLKYKVFTFLLPADSIFIYLRNQSEIVDIDI